MNGRNKSMLYAVVGLAVVVVVVFGVLMATGVIGGPGAPTVVNGCSISRGVNCPNWNLANVDLHGLTFSNGTLNSTDFSYSNANNAKFDGANLQGAKFVNTALGSASFDKADVTKVDFTGAVFGNATFSGTIYCSTKMPDGTLRTDPGRTCP